MRVTCCIKLVVGSEIGSVCLHLPGQMPLQDFELQKIQDNCDDLIGAILTWLQSG